MIAKRRTEPIVLRYGRQVGIVDAQERHTGIRHRVVDNLPEETRHRQLIPVVQVDVHHVAVNVFQLGHAVGARVHNHVQLSANGQLPDSVLQVEPVLAVEGLPLGRHVDEMIAGVHPAVEEKVRVGRQMPTSQKEAAVEVLHIFVRQILRE